MISLLTPPSDIPPSPQPPSLAPPALTESHQTAVDLRAPASEIPEIQKLQAVFLNDLKSDSLLLTEIAQYYVKRPSKHLRSRLIFLMSQATNGLGSDWAAKRTTAEDSSIPSAGSVLPSQVRLAEIIEMIHVASLLHDDVLDESALRRGAASAPATFGNKKSVLGGDYLLGKSMSICASLKDAEVMHLIASVISTLVEGELLQAQDEAKAQAEKDAASKAEVEAEAVDSEGRRSGEFVPGSQLAEKNWNDYLQKTYMKTASLISRALLATVILGGATESDSIPVRDIAQTYGTELGMAFQLVDDILDFEGGEALGKPSDGADLKLGLATAPVFFAWEENEEMGPLIKRRFLGPGDVQKAQELVRNSSALARTKALACQYVDRARDALSVLPLSPARLALEAIAGKVVGRDR